MEPLAVVMALAMGTHPRLSRGERLRPYVAREPDAARAQPPAAPPPASGQASGESEASPESPPGDPSPPRERAPHLPPAVEVSHVTRAVTGAGSTGEEQAPLEAVDGGEKSDGRQKEAEGTGDAVPSQPTEDADMLAKPDARDAEAVPAMVVVPVVPLSVPEEAKVRAGEAKAETAVQEANTAHLLEGGVEEGAVAGESENIAREEPGEQEEGAHAALPEEMQVAPAAEHAGVAEHEVVAGEMTTTTPQVLADGHGGVDSQDSNGVAEGGEPTGEEDPEEEKEWKKTGMRPEMALFDTLKGDSAALRILVTCIAEALQWRIVRTRPQVALPSFSRPKRAVRPLSPSMRWGACRTCTCCRVVLLKRLRATPVARRAWWRVVAWLTVRGVVGGWQVGDNGEEEELTEEDVVARIAEARVVFDQVRPPPERLVLCLKLISPPTPATCGGRKSSAPELRLSTCHPPRPCAVRLRVCAAGSGALYPHRNRERREEKRGKEVWRWMDGIVLGEDWVVSSLTRMPEGRSMLPNFALLSRPPIWRFAPASPSSLCISTGDTRHAAGALHVAQSTTQHIYDDRGTRVFVARCCRSGAASAACWEGAPCIHLTWWEGARGMHLTRRLGSRQVGEEEVKNLIKEFDPKRTGSPPTCSLLVVVGGARAEEAGEGVQACERTAWGEQVLQG